VEGSGFLAASTLDVMEACHDLRKFITEFPVAQRWDVLSSGREPVRDVDPVHLTAQREGNVGRLTPWAGIESPTTMGSDQTAAEALQRQGPKSAFGAMVDRSTCGWAG
jgi:hypothetical protein